MGYSTRFVSIFLGLFIVFCVGIGLANAAGTNNSRSLVEKTGRSEQEVEQQNIKEAAKGIVQDYFNALILEPEAGVIPLTAFSIGRVDATDPTDIKVAVTLTYEDDFTLPTVDYSVIKVNHTYQVQKQVCVSDADPDSPTYGTIHCSKSN